MSRASSWWPTPTDASRWFDEEERRSSVAYHRPIERAVVTRTAAQAVAVAVVWWLVAAERLTGPIAPAVALAVALGLPRIAADAWREFVHEPSFDSDSVAPGGFVAVAVGRSIVEAGALVGVAWLLDTVSLGVGAFVVLGVVALAVPLLSMLLGPRVVLALHRVTAVPADHPAVAGVDALAARFGLVAPELVRLDAATFGGSNAYVTVRRDRTVIAVSQQLLDEPPDVFDHVVAHELAHLDQGHLRWSTAAASVSLLISVVGATWVSEQVSSGEARLPALVVIASALSLPLRWAQAWLGRAHERQADQAALGVAPIDVATLRALHLTDRALLEPGLLSRLQGVHPSPPERLELAHRA